MSYGRPGPDCCKVRSQCSPLRAPTASVRLLTAARHLERVDARLARDTYLDAWGAALFAGRLSPRSTLLDVSRAARSAPRAPGPPGPSDLLLDSLSTLIINGREAATAQLEEAVRTLAGTEIPAAESLRWGWLSVVPTYVLWDEDTAHFLCDRQLAALRDAGALARLPLDLKTFSLLAVRCGDLAGAAAAAAETHAITEATGMNVPPVNDMMLAVMLGREAEARALIPSTKRDSLALGRESMSSSLTGCWRCCVMVSGIMRKRWRSPRRPATTVRRRSLSPRGRR